ncbi:hypothetical protein K474DRAFT_1751947, partial [Panus rudis PR-1116 ss-1]
MDASPRVASAAALPWDVLATLYRKGSRNDICQEFISVVLASRGTQVDPTRVHNRRKGTGDVQYVQEDLDLPAVQHIALDEHRVHLRPLIVPQGPDVGARPHDEEEEDDLDPEVANLPLQEQVNWLFRQFVYDVFQVAPNHKAQNKPSHLCMSHEDMRKVTVDIFKSLNLVNVFPRVQVRRVDLNFWRSILFQRYFPRKGTPPKEVGKLQNFPYTRYYPNWIHLTNRLSTADASYVRDRIWSAFKELHWLPHTGSDRMWPTKVDRTLTHYPVHEANKRVPCPQIAINMSVAFGEVKVRMDMAEEEEEEE